MGEERKVRFDQSLPGETRPIAAFPLFFILVVGLRFGWGRRYERSRQGDRVEYLIPPDSDQEVRKNED